MSKNDTDKTQVKQTKKRQTKSEYPKEIKDGTIRRNGPVGDSSFKYTISMSYPDGKPADVSKITMIANSGNTVVTTTPSGNLTAESDSEGEKTFYIVLKPGLNIYVPKITDTLVIQDNGREKHRTPVEIVVSEQFEFKEFEKYGTLVNQYNQQGKYQYLKVSRDITDMKDKGEIVLGVIGNIASLNDFQFKGSGIDIEIRRDSRIVDASGNYIGPVTIDGVNYTDILIVTMKNKPTEKKTYLSAEVQLWNKSYSRYDSIPPVVFEWVFKAVDKQEIEVVDLDAKKPSGNISSVKQLTGRKINLFIANENLPQDLTAGAYITAELDKVYPTTNTVTLLKDGRNVSIYSPVPVNGKLVLKGVPDTKFEFEDKIIDFVFEEDTAGMETGEIASKVRVQNDKGRWLTINFNSRPQDANGVDVNMVGDDLLTRSKLENLIEQISPKEGQAVFISKPSLLIEGMSKEEIDKLNGGFILNNDFNIDLLSGPVTAFKTRIFGLEFKVTKRDGSMIENLYNPPTQTNASVGSLEHRGFFLLNPVVGVNKCKLFALNYNETSGRMVNSNMLRLDDAKNVLIKSDRRKYDQPLELKLWYRYIGDLNSEWESIEFTYVQNPTAPFYYNMTRTVESKGDYNLIGMIEYKGKTIEALKKSTNVILEELNNDTDKEITTGTNLKLKYVLEEIRAQKESGGKPVWTNKIDYSSEVQLTQEECQRDFSKLNLFMNKTIVANTQYWYSVKLGFEMTNKDGTKSEVEIFPHLNGYDLTEIDGYGVIPFNITNFNVAGTSSIQSLPEFKKGQKRVFDFQDEVKVYIYTIDRGPVLIDPKEYKIERYIWDVIPLDQGTAGKSIREVTTIPTFELKNEMRDGRYEVRVSVDLDRFGVFELAKRPFTINQLDVETPENAKDPETVVIGEYDGLDTVKVESEGWRYYGEIETKNFQDSKVKYSGRYDPTRAYSVGEEVNNAGSLYLCIVDTPTDGKPYSFKSYFKGINNELSKSLYKSGLLSPYEVLNRLGMDSNYSNVDKPSKTNPSYNHNTKESSWFKVKNPYGELLYISRYPVLRNIKLNELAKADMLHPYQRTIRIGNYLYYPRWLIQEATFPYEPLFKDFKDNEKYFQDNGIEMNMITRNEEEFLLKMIDGTLSEYSNSEIGVDSSKHAEFIYHKDFPKLLKYESYKDKKAEFKDLRVGDGDTTIIPGLRLVLERIPDDEKPYNNINDSIPGSNEIFTGSLDPFADTAFLDYVEVGRFLDMQDVLLKTLKFTEGERIQSLGFYKFYHQGQMLFISDSLNLKEVTLEKLDKHNLVNYSPKVTDVKPLKQQTIDKVGRVVFSKMPYSISLLQALTCPMIRSEVTIDGEEVKIFENDKTTYDFKLSEQCSFTDTMMGIMFDKTPQDLSAGYKGSLPDLDLSSIVKGIGTLSETEGVLTRTTIKDTEEIVIQKEKDLFRLGKINKTDKGRVVFVLSTPATSLKKTNVKK